MIDVKQQMSILLDNVTDLPATPYGYNAASCVDMTANCNTGVNYCVFNGTILLPNPYNCCTFITNCDIYYTISVAGSLNWASCYDVLPGGSIRTYLYYGALCDEYMRCCTYCVTFTPYNSVGKICGSSNKLFWTMICGSWSHGSSLMNYLKDNRTACLFVRANASTMCGMCTYTSGAWKLEQNKTLIASMHARQSVSLFSGAHLCINNGCTLIMPTVEDYLC